MKYVILKCGVATQYTGRIYPRNVMQDALDEYMQTGNKFGTLFDYTVPMDMNKISHKVNDMYIDANNNLCADIEVMNAPMGTLLQTIPLRLSFVGGGDMNAYNVVSTFKIYHTVFDDIINADPNVLTVLL